jgi:hypothetical protein
METQMRVSTRANAVVLLLGLLLACIGPIASVQSNVPSSRLTAEQYTSPNGEFHVGVPPLLHPGAQIQEVVGPSGELAVAFTDEFGHAYAIQWAHLAAPLPTLESIEQDFAAEAVVKEHGIVTSTRGRELRMAGTHAGGSPLVSQTTRNGDLVVKRLDLVEAWCIFFAKDIEYRIKAGVTVLDGVDAATLIPKAKADLDHFLAGFVIQG